MTGRVSGRPSPVRMGAVVVCALIASLLAVPPAQAEHYEEVREVVAPDGVAAAVAYSKLTFPDGSAQAVLGRADVFADSLASGVLQKDAPLLLTASNALSEPTEDELERLGAKTVTILGGTSAISTSVENSLKSKGYTVRRVAGATRIETAAAVARAAGRSSVALIARSDGGSEATAAFADALAAGGWAAQTGWPILLTETNRLSGPTAQVLREGVQQAWVVGGRAAVGDEVLAQIRALGVDAQRVSGASRFDTAVAVANRRGFPSAANASEVVLVDGQGPKAWTDGFAAAAYSGRNRAPIVLANSVAQLPEATLAFLRAGPAAKLLTGWTVPQAQVDQAAQSMGKDVAVTRIFQVRMNGRNVVRAVNDANEPIWGHGEDEATGLLTMTVDDEAEAIDYTFETTAEGGYDDGALTLRKGALNERGDTVVRFPEIDDEGKGSGRVTAEDFELEGFTLAELIAAPGAFYAELSTNDFEDGAVRGQLPTGGDAHLPGEPTFTAIESKEADNWIRLKFAAPVFLADDENGKLTADDFLVTVDNGVHAPLVAGDAGFKDVPTNSASPADSFQVVLAGTLVPVAGKETTVELKASGARKLINNLGQHPDAGIRRQVTVADTVRPQFTSVEVSGSSTAMFLNFSEAVWYGQATFPASGLTVTVRAGGTTTTPTATVSAPTTKGTRATRWSVSLSAPVPSGAEVRATFSTTAAANIKDAKDNLLEGDVSRAAAATVAGARIVETTVTDLVLAGPPTSDPTNNQRQTLRVKLGESQKGPLSIKLPAAADFNYANSVRVTVTAPGMSTPPVLSGTVSGTTATIGDASTSLPSGATVTVTFLDVDVLATTNTSSETSDRRFELVVSRADSGATASAKFDLRRGVYPHFVSRQSSTQDSLAPGNTFESLFIKFKVRGPMAAGSSVTFDLSPLGTLTPPGSTPLTFDTGLIQAGITFPKGQPTAGASAGGALSAEFVGAARDQVFFTHSQTLPANTEVTLSFVNIVALGDAVPAALDYRFDAIREDVGGERSAPYVCACTRVATGSNKIEALPAPNGDVVGDVTFADGWHSTAAGRGAPNGSQLFQFSVVRSLPAGQAVTFTFPSSNGLAYPTSPTVTWLEGTQGVVSTSVVSSNVVVRYQAPANAAVPSGPVRFRIDGVDARNAVDGANVITVTIARTDGGSVPSDSFRPSGAPPFLLTGADFTDHSVSPPTDSDTTFGNEVGDVLALTFTSGASITTANIQNWKLQLTGETNAIPCDTVNVACDVNGNVVTMRVVSTTAPDFSMTSRTVHAATGFASNATLSVVYPGHKSVT